MKKLAFISNVLLLVGIFSVFATSCKKDKTTPEPTPASKVFKIGGLVETSISIDECPDNKLYAYAASGDMIDSISDVVGISKIGANKFFEMELNTPTKLYAFDELYSETVSFIPEETHINISNPDAKTAFVTMLGFDDGIACGRAHFNNAKGDDMLVRAHSSLLEEENLKLIIYMYVDQDVRIEGEGASSAGIPAVLDLDLKKGWNIILLTIPILEDEDKDDTTIIVENISEVSEAYKWFMLGETLGYKQEQNKIYKELSHICSYQ